MMLCLSMKRNNLASSEVFIPVAATATQMISVQSICVAVAATGMRTSDEARLFRFMLRHSIILASVIGLITLLYAYVIPQCVR